MLIITLTLLLTGCDLFGGNVTTTAEITTVEVDTENFIDIAHVTDLQNIEMNKSYRLVADMNISGLDWQPLGTYEQPFRGIFDGNGHTITGLNIITKHDSFNGLFGYLNGEVRNLNLVNINISYTANFLTYAGGIAGFTDGNIVDCTVSGNINITNSLSNSFVGLLTGFSQGELNASTTVDDFSPNQISGNNVRGTIQVNAAQMAFIGGLVGKAYNSSIYENIADTTISVVATGTSVPVYVGGFIGHNYGGILLDFTQVVEQPNIYIEKNVSYSEITVTNESSESVVGGFIGFNQKGYIRDNFSESDIEDLGTLTEFGTRQTGGFIGQNFESTVERIVAVIHEWERYENSCSLYVDGDYSELATTDVFLLALGEVVSATPTSLTCSDEWEFITETDLADADFFETELNWTSDFYNIFIG